MSSEFLEKVLTLFRSSLYSKVTPEGLMLKEISTEDFILPRKLRIWARKWRGEAVREWVSRPNEVMESWSWEERWPLRKSRDQVAKKALKNMHIEYIFFKGVCSVILQFNKLLSFQTWHKAIFVFSIKCKFLARKECLVHGGSLIT